MKDLTITQEYMICAVNEKGILPSYKNEAVACFIASGILEMQMENCISIENKKVTVNAALPEKMEYLRPLYEIINQEKPVKLDKVFETYMVAFTDKKLHELTDSIMNSLKDANVIVPVKAGIIKNKENYVPAKETVNYVIEKIRAELLEDGEFTEDVIALTVLLDRAGYLKDYFSKHEKSELKKRLSEIKDSEAGKSIKDMVNNVEGIVSLMLITAGVSSITNS